MFMWISIHLPLRYSELFHASLDHQSTKNHFEVWSVSFAAYNPRFRWFNHFLSINSPSFWRFNSTWTAEAILKSRSVHVVSSPFCCKVGPQLGDQVFAASHPTNLRGRSTNGRWPSCSSWRSTWARWDTRPRARPGAGRSSGDFLSGWVPWKMMGAIWLWIMTLWDDNGW